MPQTDEYLIKILLDVQNDKALKSMTTQLEKTAKQVPRTSKAFNSASKASKGFGRQTQNLSFQLQDFIVQTQGGTSALRAFGQQAPQALVGFGAMGAAIGVVLALAPALITFLKGAVEETIKLSETTINMGAAFKTVDMKGWIKDWEALDKAQKAASLSALDYTRVIRSQGLSQTVEGLTQGVATQGPGRGVGRPGAARQKAFAKSVEDAGKALGISIKQFKEFNAQITAFEASGFTDTAAIGAAQQVLYGAVDPDKYNKKLAATVKQVEELAVSAKQFQDTSGSNLLQEIEINAERVGDPKRRGSKGSIEDLQEIETKAISLQTTLNILANDRLQDQNEFLEGERNLRIQYAKTAETAVESLTIQQEAAQAFESSFEAAVNGVASGTQKLSEAFENMVKSILAQLLKLLAQRAILSAFGLNLAPAAKGAVIDGGQMTAFAKGGVVSSPTIFPLANGAGLMGEKGAEGILPLSRMSNGNLGVESTGMNVTINNLAPGVDVRASQGDNGLTIDVVMATIANAVQRGGNNVADSLEQSYALNRGRAVY